MKLVEDVFVEGVEAGTTISLHVESGISHALHQESKHLFDELVVEFHEHELKMVIEEVL